jgi:hypothetical protein
MDLKFLISNNDDLPMDWGLVFVIELFLYFGVRPEKPKEDFMEK